MGKLGGRKQRLQAAVEVGKEVRHIGGAELLKLGLLPLVERGFLGPEMVPLRSVTDQSKLPQLGLEPLFVISRSVITSTQLFKLDLVISVLTMLLSRSVITNALLLKLGLVISALTCCYRG